MRESECETLLVTYGSEQIPCLLLRWTQRQHLQWNDSLSRDFLCKSVRVPRLGSIHADGTSISCYTLVGHAAAAYGERQYALSSNSSAPAGGEPIDLGDIDILEPEGYDAVMECVRRAWRRVDCRGFSSLSRNLASVFKRKWQVTNSSSPLLLASAIPSPPLYSHTPSEILVPSALTENPVSLLRSFAYQCENNLGHHSTPPFRS